MRETGTALPKAQLNRQTYASAFVWLAALLVAAVLFAPASFPPVLVMVALAVVPLYLAVLFVRNRAWRSPFNLPILVLLVAILFSLYASVDLRTSLPPLCGVFLALVILYTVSAPPGRWVTPTRILFAAWLIGLVLAALTLAAAEPVNKFLPLAGLAPVLPQPIPALVLVLRDGRALNPNVAAGMMLLVLPLNVAALALLPAPLTRKLNKIPPLPQVPLSVVRTILVVSVGITLVIFALQQSRSALFGLALGLFFLAWMSFPAYRTRLLAAAAIIAVLAVVILAEFGMGPIGLVDADLARKLPSRLEIWQRGGALFLDFPLTGVGLGTFPLVANALYPFFFHRVTEPPPHAHNFLLQAASELGGLGILGYLGLLAEFVFCIWNAYRRTSDRSTRLTIVGVAAGMLAYQVYGLTDGTGMGTRASLLFWLALGTSGALALEVRETSSADESVTPQSPFPPFVSRMRNGKLPAALGLGAIILVLLGLAVAWAQIRNCGFAVNATAIRLTRSIAATAPNAVRLGLIDPVIPDSSTDAPCAVALARLQGIEQLLLQDDTQSALETLNHAYAMNPNELGTQLWLARTSEEMGQLERAVSLWKQVGNTRHLRVLARASERAGEMDQAINIWNVLGNTSRLQELARKSERENNLERAIRLWRMAGNNKRLEEIAIASERAGEIERAIQLWRELGNRKRLEEIARRSERDGELERAIQLWRELGNRDRLEEIARKSEQGGDIERAIDLWRELSNQPRLEEIARKSEQGGDIERALAIWRELDNRKQLERIAYKSEQGGDIERALAIWRELGNREQLEGIASRSEQSGEIERAIALWRELGERGRLEGIARQSESKGQVELALALWRELGERGQLERIAYKSERDGAWERAIGLWRELGNREQLGGIARKSERDGAWERAIELWLELGDAAALNRIVSALDAKDTTHLKLALAALTRVAPLEGTNYLELARLLLAEDRMDEAKMTLVTAARKKTDLVWLYRLLGDMYANGGQPRQEIATYQDALTFVSQRGPLYLPLGTALLQQGQIQDAIPHLRLAAEFEPENDYAHATLARALWRNDRAQEALAALTRALCLQPSRKEYRVLWNAYVQDSAKKGIEGYPVEFSAQVCAATHALAP